MGHIKLAAPVSHIWFFKGVPSRIGLPAGHRPQGAREGPVLRRQLCDHHGERGEACRRPRPAGRQGRLAARASRRLRARTARAPSTRCARRCVRSSPAISPRRTSTARRSRATSSVCCELLRHLRDVSPAGGADQPAWSGGDGPGAAQGREARRRLHRPRLQGRGRDEEPDRPGVGSVQGHRAAQRGQ